MTATDAVNARFGRNTLRPGGFRKVTPWSTRIAELMEVRA